MGIIYIPEKIDKKWKQNYFYSKEAGGWVKKDDMNSRYNIYNPEYWIKKLIKGEN